MMHQVLLDMIEGYNDECYLRCHSNSQRSNDLDGPGDDESDCGYHDMLFVFVF